MLGGIGPCSGVGHFLVDKAADCAYHLAPGHWLQTGPCIPYGQDLNLSLDRVLGNRNLTNKLWNAGKFLQMQLADCSESEFQELAAADFSSAQSLADLPLVERWILSALHQVCFRPLALSD